MRLKKANYETNQEVGWSVYYQAAEGKLSQTKKWKQRDEGRSERRNNPSRLLALYYKIKASEMDNYS